MARVISIHEYDLKPGADVAAFERAIRDAERRGLFGLAGLVEHHFLRGIKGARRDAYSAVWVFESRKVWEKLWGSPEAPRPLAEYPKERRCGRTIFSHHSRSDIPTRSASQATKNSEIQPR